MANGGTMSGAGKQPFFFFCDTVLECTAGKKEWKLQKYKLEISASCATVSDEAFALLLLVNSWDKFEFLSESDMRDVGSDAPPTLFTEKRGRNKKMQGWSNQGIDKFNQLCQFVIADRSSAEGQKFEMEFLEHQKAKLLLKKQQVNCDVQEDDSDSIGEGGGGGGNEGDQSRWAYNQLYDLVVPDGVVSSETFDIGMVAESELI